MILKQGIIAKMKFSHFIKNVQKTGTKGDVSTIRKEISLLTTHFELGSLESFCVHLQIQLSLKIV